MLFPWPGFFELVSLADVYVHLDDVQFSKGSFTNRIQLKHPTGRKWMTIPLKGKGLFQIIHDLEAGATDWKQAHRALLVQSLDGAPYLSLALDLMDRAYRFDRLADNLTASVEMPASILEFDRPAEWITASSLKVAETSSQRVLSIVKAVGGTRYVTAHGAANYLDHESFERAGIAVDYIDYSKTPYPQLHGDFAPYVSILDLAGNLGPQAHDVIRPKTVPWREFLSSRSAAL